MDSESIIQVIRDIHGGGNLEENIRSVYELGFNKGRAFGESQLRGKMKQNMKASWDRFIDEDNIGEHWDLGNALKVIEELE